MNFSKFAPHVSGLMHRIYIKWLNNESGSSLVENLVAIGVVGVGLAGFAALSGNISVLGDKSSQKSVAITMAQDKIETIKNLSTKTSDQPLTIILFLYLLWLWSLLYLLCGDLNRSKLCLLQF
jgi:type II secretory pathway pseudopilin PulG